MERYEEYKDSGVQWLGEIPGHWEAKRLGSFFDERRDKVSDKDYPALSVSKEGVTPQLETAVKTDNGDNRKKVIAGDFVVNSRSDRKGSCGYSKLTGSVSLINIVLTPRKEIDGVFCHYLFRSSSYIEEYYRNGKGIVADLWTTNYQSMKTIMIPLPPLPEQQAIVSFLDTKTSQIDTYIAGKEKEIDLLKSTKQRIIADAVTKGIKPGVEMKESGIAWVGKIPAHWKVQKLKTIVEERKVKNKGNIETNVLSLSYGNIIRKKNVNAGLCPDDYSTYQIVEPGNIILRLTDLQNDHRSLRTGLVLEKGIITSAYLCLQTALDSFYLQQILHSYDLMKVFYTMGDGLRQSMSYKDVCSLSIPIAPVEEQRSIVAHIKEKSESIDSAIEKLTDQIELMKKYKQRLISDVVTGQIKVC